MMKLSMILLLLLGIPVIGFSTTINVPGDYLTIQEAISAAVAGDTVLVAPGTYAENIDLMGKAIKVESSHGPNLTVIDGGNLGSVVTFSNGAGLDSVLSGFTVTNGTGTYNSTHGYLGGGIVCFGSSPTIKNNCIVFNSANIGGGLFMSNDSSPLIIKNLFANNTAYFTGGGLFASGFCAGRIEGNCFHGNLGQASAGGAGFTESCTTIFKENVVTANTTNQVGAGIYCHNDSDLTLTGNLIQDNVAVNKWGGGIACWISSPVIQDNMILQNSAGMFGGGIGCKNNSSPLIVNNTIAENIAAEEGGGIACRQNSYLTITNMIQWSNDAPTGPELYIGDPLFPSTVTISYSNLEGGQAAVHTESDCTLNWGPGMIDADPLFVELANSDLHLTYISPCRDAGDNSAVAFLYDFEGDPRLAWGGTVDMGADEFYTHLYITGDQTPGGDIQGKFVGLPGTSPVGLFIGLGGVRPTPLPTAYGDLWLLPPRLSIPLIPIPFNGILTIPTTIPMSPPAPYDIIMQGLVGLNTDSLTNLCVLEVR